MAPTLALIPHPSPTANPHPRQAGLWLRNIQLGMFALPLAAGCMAYQDYEQLRDYGPLQGF